LTGRIRNSHLNITDTGAQKQLWKPNKRVQRMVLGADVGLEET